CLRVRNTAVEERELASGIWLGESRHGIDLWHVRFPGRGLLGNGEESLFGSSVFEHSPFPVFNPRPVRGIAGVVVFCEAFVALVLLGIDEHPALGIVPAQTRGANGFPRYLAVVRVTPVLSRDNRHPVFIRQAGQRYNSNSTRSRCGQLYG